MKGDGLIHRRSRGSWSLSSLLPVFLRRPQGILKAQEAEIWVLRSQLALAAPGPPKWGEMVKEEKPAIDSSSRPYLVTCLSRAEAGHFEIQMREGLGATALSEQGMEGDGQSLEPCIWVQELASHSLAT